MLFALLALATAAEPPTVNERTTEYEISGSTSKQLLKSLDANGPTDEYGRHDAVTKWYVRWKSDYDRQPEACYLVNIRVTVAIQFIVPKWSGEGDLGDRWEKYLEKLTAHERNHAKNGIEAAKTVLAAIPKLP